MDAKLEQKARELLAHECAVTLHTVTLMERSHERVTIGAAIRAITRALQAQPAEGGVAPISEPPADAPPHSIPVLVYLPEFGWRRGHYTKCYAATAKFPWAADGFATLDAKTITHWRPLPAAPKPATTTGEGVGS